MKRSEWFKTLAGCDVSKYVLKSYVGCGRIGYVYMGHSRDMLEFDLAIKIVPGDPKAGFENEILKAVKLRGISGVVAYHDQGAHVIKHAGENHNVHFTVWDYIQPGRNLKQYLEEINYCPASFLVAVIEQVLRVLHACENRDVKRHGDLHSGNILIGNKDAADLDSSNRPREPIFISDFGYGATGGKKKPKDDYVGLSKIFDDLVSRWDRETSTTTDKQLIDGIQKLLLKLLKESSGSERRPPLEILTSIGTIKRNIGSASKRPSTVINKQVSPDYELTVGQFQVSEMLGDDWQSWRSLFVPGVPARSRILEPKTATVVTGPRGCGKTMLFRRLSERLEVECGSLDRVGFKNDFVGLYINANDIADAFSSFSDHPSKTFEKHLICYANLCILSDFLAVESARRARLEEIPNEAVNSLLDGWLKLENDPGLLAGEDPLERHRSILERIKWNFPTTRKRDKFAGYKDFSRHEWFPRFITLMRNNCSWIGKRVVFLFVDDYTTPRISDAMQAILNRLFFQRSAEFVCKIATESAATFLPKDSSGKSLQDGDDYQLIDIGEESLFMSDEERRQFLGEVFKRRLSLDRRVPQEGQTLEGLLHHLPFKKVQFARRLRAENVPDQNDPTLFQTKGASQRRGATSPKALYYGSEVLRDLWSGDTRTTIQLIQELVDGTFHSDSKVIEVPIEAEVQDRVFRNRGGQWLEALVRNQPTSPSAVEHSINLIKGEHKDFALAGGNYGTHLKAIVEAFVHVARHMLMGPLYRLREGDKIREVPRMAFRIEVIDEFRLSTLAAELYKDLLRYGIFMRDARGKSVRGAFVPRLYLRRLLLPYSTLALSKRDSVQMTNEWFTKLLLTPDIFKADFVKHLDSKSKEDPNQYQLALGEESSSAASYFIDPQYDDTNE